MQTEPNRHQSTQNEADHADIQVPSAREEATWVDKHQDLREAGTATAVKSGYQLEIQLGHFCNDRCVFCVSGQLSAEKLAKPIGTDPVFEALENGARSGIKRVTFLGGEPTIQKSFIPSLQKAVDLGYEDIVIFTNLARGSSRKFLEKVVSMGRFTWRISVQGGNREAHEAATDRDTSWKRIVDGLRTLHELDQDMTANMCVNALSYKSLPDYPEFLTEHGVRQLHVDMVRPASIGRRTDNYRKSILPTHSEMKPYIRKMLEGFEAIDEDYDVNIGNYAFCMLPEWAHKIHHGGEPTLTLTTDDYGELNTLRNKYVHQKWDAVYGVECGKCVFIDRCRGVPAKYQEFYGTDEFEPVTHAQLLYLDERQKSFTVMARQWIEPLMQVRPPEGWALKEYFEDSRERVVEVRYEHTGGIGTTLRFTPVVDPLKGESDPVLRTNYYRMAVQPHGPLAPGELRALVDSVAEVLLAVEGIDLEERRLPTSTGEAVDLELAKVLKLARKIQRSRISADWNYSGLKRIEGQPAVVLTLARPDGQSIHLHLSKQRGKGVSARFELGEGTKSAVAKPVVKRISEVMRG